MELRARRGDNEVHDCSSPIYASNYARLPRKVLSTKLCTHGHMIEYRRFAEVNSLLG